MQDLVNLKLNTKLTGYIPIPCRLLKSELCGTSLLIYGMLLDRALLSQKNRWHKDGDVFVRYPINQIAQDIGKGQTTVKNSLRELEWSGLIKRKREGFNKCNLIFVRIPEECVKVKKTTARQTEKCTSEGENSTPHTDKNATSNYYTKLQNISTKLDYIFGEGESF